MGVMNLVGTLGRMREIRSFYKTASFVWYLVSRKIL